MKIFYDKLNLQLDLAESNVKMLVIQNPMLLREFLIDIKMQIDSGEISNTLYIGDTLDFSANKIRTVMTKLNTDIKLHAIDEMNYSKTERILHEINEYANDLSVSMQNAAVSHTKIEIQDLIKSLGFHMEENFSEFVYNILENLKLIAKYQKVKLFVISSLLQYLTNDERTFLNENVCSLDFSLLLIESTSDCNLFDKIIITNEGNTIYD